MAEVNIVLETVKNGQLPAYDGSYTITPTEEAQTIPTAGKSLLSDITVEAGGAIGYRVLGTVGDLFLTSDMKVGSIIIDPLVGECMRDCVCILIHRDEIDSVELHADKDIYVSYAGYSGKGKNFNINPLPLHATHEWITIKPLEADTTITDNTQGR